MLIPTATEADDIILQETIQLSIAEQKSHDDLEAKLNEEKVKEHLMAEEIQKLVEGTENVGNDEVDSSVKSYMSNHILHVHPTQAIQAFAQEQQYQLYLTMKDNHQLQHDDLPIWLTLKFKFKRLYMSNTLCRPSTIHPREKDDLHDDAHPERENSAKRQKTSEHGTYVIRESSSDDDEFLTEKVSQELVEEISQTVDEAKLRKVVNEMLRQRCTSGDEHKYHINHVYYVEGLGHNFSRVGQFCDGDLEVAFRSKTCYVRNLEGDDMLTGAQTIQLSIAEQKSHDDLEAKLNEKKVKEHLMAEEIEKLVEGTENVGTNEVDNSISHSQNDPSTKLEHLSKKESPEVEIIADVQSVNVNEEEEESAEDDYKLKRKENGKNIEETRNTPSP
nr:integrase, catalytic region, zinc finger, CCHC-type, peptidase aspartic, catalytic [Tanacetum cinerariifolium]